jgi:hypothetical protein
MPEKSQTKKIFRLRPKAESDLENIYAYSYKEFGLSKAVQLSWVFCASMSERFLRVLAQGETRNAK